ncbi:MAG: acetate kinase, partial [Armatimonadota bacterium]
RQAVAMMADVLVGRGNGGVIDSLSEITAVGHRVVHGGERFSAPAVIDNEVEAAIRECAELAPLHNPPNLTGIQACRQLFQERGLPVPPQVAVFDTAFHQTLPAYAYRYAIPERLYKEWRIRRYGFHGTSHQYVDMRAREWLSRAGRDTRDAKVVTCHLGNGCSISAVRGGRCVDTSMGMTPLEGLVMGTRSGDIDPAIVTVLMDRYGMSADEVDNLLNKRSGLLGLSGLSSDMRDVESAMANGDAKAALAFEVFCYRAKKYVGAYAAALGGLDALVFTAGIGENSPAVRERICQGLEFLGVEIDPELNSSAQRGERSIGRAGARAAVLVIPTDEEWMIAKQASEVLNGG